MGQKSSGAAAAREKARQARLKLDADRDARDRHVEDAVAQVIIATDDIRAADKALATVIAAARSTRKRAVTGAEKSAAAALGRLRAQGLTREQIGTLTELEPGRLRRLLQANKAPTSGRSPNPEPAADTAGQSNTEQDGLADTEQNGAPSPTAAGAGE